MRRFNRMFARCAASIAVSAVCICGCGSPAQKTASIPAEESQVGQEPATDELGAEASHDHSGWWCPEHGVPEEECTRCDSSLIAEFKSKGDWCDEHSRPDSQCFLCTPELEARFAARYEAKYGEPPPKPTDP